jgi:hypothetical protein
MLRAQALSVSQHRLAPIDHTTRDRLHAALSTAAPIGFCIPSVMISGYQLASASPSRDGGTVLTAEFSSSGGRRLEWSQRSAWLPLDEELAGARVPYARLIGEPIFVVSGAYGGEPIDRSFWFTRQAVCFQHGLLITELREIVGKGPGLVHLVSLARSLRAAKPNTKESTEEKIT